MKALVALLSGAFELDINDILRLGISKFILISNNLSLL